MVSIMEIMQLCRLCLVKEQVNIPIFEDQGDIRQIFLKITACLPVKVSKEDQLPKKICDGCLYKLELLYQFWNTTANAEKQLLSWIEQSNMELNSKSSDEPSTNTPPQVKQEKIEPTESTNENADLSADAQNYILQQQQLAYQAEFPYKESQGSNVEGEDAADDSEEPVPKRRRRSQRRQATKPIPPESLDSSDNEAADTFMEMAVTKTEEESESDGDENVDDPESSKFVTATEDPEQPGPSGLGKGTTEAPSGSRIWQCKICKQGFYTKKHLNDHVRDSHVATLKEISYNYFYNNVDEIFSCKKCDAEMNTQEAIEQHVLQHNEKYECKECPDIFYSPYEYSVHMKKCHGDETYKCPFCPYNTQRLTSISQHIKLMHLSRYLHHCKFCGEGFHDIAAFKEHESVHLEAYPLTCVVCGQQFSYSRNLITHQVSFHSVTTIPGVTRVNQCRICEKVFAKPNSLVRHAKIHQNTKPTQKTYLCDICGKGFARKNKLDLHYRVHTGYKPHKCSYCEKSFTKKDYLVLHERIHSGEKPYCCIYCTKRFNQDASLRIHMRIHTGERPYTCTICNNSFISKSSLKFHRNNCRGC